MELYGCGFNAHGQVMPIVDHGGDSSVAKAINANGCTEVFTRLASGPEIIEVLYASWRETVVLIGEKLFILGASSAPSADTSCKLLKTSNSFNTGPALRSAFGSQRGLLGFVNPVQGRVSLIEHPVVSSSSSPTSDVLLRDVPVEAEQNPKILHLAITLSGRTAAILNTSPRGLGLQSVVHIVQHDSFEQFTAWYQDPSNEKTRPAAHHILPCSTGDVSGRMLLATATGWVLLTGAGGDVYTWGDYRFADLLGRQPVAKGQEDTPGLVDALGGLGVMKISTCTGGSLVAALTQAGEVWLWGRSGVAPSSILSIPGEHTTQVLDTLGGSDTYGEPARVELPGAGETELADVSVGKSHVIVLDCNGNVHVAGSNKYGQLGLNKEHCSDPDAFHPSWTGFNGPFNVTEQQQKKIVGVRCGHLTSFLLVRHAL